MPMVSLAGMLVNKLSVSKHAMSILHVSCNYFFNFMQERHIPLKTLKRVNFLNSQWKGDDIITIRFTEKENRSM